MKRSNSPAPPAENKRRRVIITARPTVLQPITNSPIITTARPRTRSQVPSGDLLPGLRDDGELQAGCTRNDLYLRDTKGKKRKIRTDSLAIETACDVVFNTIELAEMIFSKLPPGPILKLRRINSLFRNTIDTSHVVEQHLFLKLATSETQFLTFGRRDTRPLSITLNSQSEILEQSSNKRTEDMIGRKRCAITTLNETLAVVLPTPPYRSSLSRPPFPSSGGGGLFMDFARPESRKLKLLVHPLHLHNSDKRLDMLLFNPPVNTIELTIPLSQPRKPLRMTQLENVRTTMRLAWERYSREYDDLQRDYRNLLVYWTRHPARYRTVHRASGVRLRDVQNVLRDFDYDRHGAWEYFALLEFTVSSPGCVVDSSDESELMEKYGRLVMIDGEVYAG